ncbi:MAG: GTP-binding protein, partial [Lachnospiraceae bacterium]|nr:GTP-binding protein [Lachnospiraceae bacterium]
MKRFTLGILAHVDSGKTTLSEALLYHAGRIKTPGRVDNKDAYLDTFALERERGITIFSKQAVFEYDGAEVTLLDTPGHVDFSSEMERTLSVLDFAVLVISGANGVQSHTRSVEKLLEHYRIPTFVFVNKMDQPGTDRAALISNINTELGNRFVSFSDEEKDEEFYENVACLSEKLLEAYLDGERPSEEDIINLIAERKLIPTYFGSALKLDNTEFFLQDIIRVMKSVSDENGSVVTTSGELKGRVYKITRDDKGDRLTHLKIFSGKLKVRDTLDESGEKINGIRIYSGEKFNAVTEAEAGMVCAVTGL